MNRLTGFSLMEVLISLLLSTGIILALVQQQWQSNKFFNQLIQQSHAHQVWKNQLEIQRRSVP